MPRILTSYINGFEDCRVERGGIPHLAKNERDMGHPELRGQVKNPG
jgi:hypothetical protein